MRDLFKKYCQFDRIDASGRRYRTTTEHLVVDEGAPQEIIAWIAARWDTPHVMIVADELTFSLVGRDLRDRLERAALPVSTYLVQPPPGHSIPLCDQPTIEALQGAMIEARPDAVLAVGAGTINDCAKMAAHRAGRPYLCFATAPSMNGFTSSIAAILEAGIKTTQPCDPPVAVFATPSMMADAPYRMIASGFGDLLSKPVSNADWALSAALLGTEHSSIVMEIVDQAQQLLEGVAARLPDRDHDAIARLTGALFLSGLGMQAAGSSGPASGGEHLISHYIDMTAYAFGLAHDFHGCQVAVGTLTTSWLYDQLRLRDPKTIDPDARAAAWPTWEVYRETLDQRFGPLVHAVEAHAVRAYPTPDALHARLTRIRHMWPRLWDSVSSTLWGEVRLREELERAAVPTTFQEIGVEPARAWRSIVHSKDIRARYTVLHLAAELGWLDDLADAYLGGRPDSAKEPAPRTFASEA